MNQIIPIERLGLNVVGAKDRDCSGVASTQSVTFCIGHPTYKVGTFK